MSESDFAKYAVHEERIYACLGPSEHAAGPAGTQKSTVFVNAINEIAKISPRQALAFCALVVEEPTRYPHMTQAVRPVYDELLLKCTN